MKLSDHFRGVCLYDLTAGQLVEGLEHYLARFGAVRVTRHRNWEEAWRDFLPLTSFPVRYLVFGLGEWSRLVDTHHLSTGSSEVLPISKQTRCRAIASSLFEDHRVFELVRAGHRERVVSCHRAHRRWTFVEEGERRGYEQAQLYTARPTSARLTPEMVVDYVRAESGLSEPTIIPAVTDILVLERSTEDVVGEILELDVDLDVLAGETAAFVSKRGDKPSW